jgi:transposase
MAGELVVMSAREIDRLNVIRQVLERRLTRVKAGELLGICPKQVARLCTAYERQGAAGLVSRKRGRSGNRKLADGVETRVVELVRELYDDFGPTLAREKLIERHGIKLAKETVRKILSRAGIWLPKDQRIPRPHQPRFRRECLGELVQIDGCEHYWFEDRAPPCSLLVYVDDATSGLMELRFVESESAFSYFAATASYLERYGKPVAFYSDKHSIFRVNRPSPDGIGVTQFGRALAELNIDIICANTPQAKGRVERMHQTLQDRLVKELRLRGISTMEAGNAFVPKFLEDFNAKFARPARNPHDAHRSLADGDDVDRSFCCREPRSMSPNLVVQFNGQSWVVTPGPKTRRLAGRWRQVMIHTWSDGRREIHHEGVSLPYTIPDEYPYPTPGEIVERKRVAEVMRRMRAAQADPERRYVVAKRLTRPRRPQKTVQIEPGGQGRQPRRRQKTALSGGRPFPRVPSKNDFLDTADRTRYFVRWVRRHAYLHERLFVGTAGALGIGPFRDRYVGRVDDRIARQWEARGNSRLPPPLLGGRLPDSRDRLAPKRSSRPPPRKVPTVAATRPSTLSLPSGESRLSAALWFADVAHAAEAERVRKFNDSVEEYNRQWYEDLVAESASAPRGRSGDRREATGPSVTTIPFRDSARGRPTAARKGHREKTRRANPPPRPRSSSGSARGPQGSPRSARRLRRP